MRTVLVCLTATAALAGCGSKTVDTEKGEQLIETEVTEQLRLEVASVKCRGARFECEGTSGGETAVIDVTQTDDQGGVDYEVRGP